MLFYFFSQLQNFLKIGIDTHPIDLSCHQKFEKNSPTRSGDIGARSWKQGKSHGRLDHTLRMREVVCALTYAAKPPVPSVLILCEKEIFFRSIVLRVTKKVTKLSWEEFYRSPLH